MTTPYGVRRLLVAAVAVSTACLDSCAGSAPDATEAATRSLFQLCSGPGLDGWTRVRGAPGNAVAKGAGPVVVLANDLTNAVCGWIPLATQLVRRGYRVVLFQYADTTPEGENHSVSRTIAVADESTAGASYALVGANFGGRIVIEAAARRPDGLRAIVSVSGEVEDNAWHDILPEARRVTTPALYVGARGDMWTEGTRQQRMLHRAMHGSPNRLLQYPGTANGLDLLDPASAVGRRAQAAVIGFVTHQLAE